MDTCYRERDPRGLLPAEVVARILGLDQVVRKPILAVHKLRKRGQLVGVRLGKRWMITPESVDALRYGS